MNGRDWLEVSLGAARPRAIAALNRVLRDLDLAEEAFGIACEKALVLWPDQGTPDDPIAWLLAVARNAAFDSLRREQRRRQLIVERNPELAASLSVDNDVEADAAALRDDVLRLLFICCHPDLSRQDQAALALRVVLGLSLADVAAAFLVTPAAMEKRLTRAKATIRDGEVTFDTPGPTERARRLRAVTLMLYLMFNEGWTSATDTPEPSRTLCEEAIRLVRLLLSLFPAEAEVQGLLALLLFHYARRDGRVSPEGRPLTLDEQPRGRWDQAMIAEGRAMLEKALRHAAPGPFQVQAAIAGQHVAARSAEATDWTEVERLYAGLLLIEDTPVIRLNHAAAVAHVAGEASALDLLEGLADGLSGYLWFHTMRAGLLSTLGRQRDAVAAYERALELDPAPAERTIVLEKLEVCKILAS